MAKPGTGRRRTARAKSNKEAMLSQLKRKNYPSPGHGKNIVNPLPGSTKACQQNLLNRHRNPQGRDTSPLSGNVIQQEPSSIKRQTKRYDLKRDNIKNQDSDPFQKASQRKQKPPLLVGQVKQPASNRPLAQEATMLKRLPLTAKNLKAYTKPSLSNQGSISSTSSSAEKSCTTTDPMFGARLNDNNISFQRSETVRPADFESIQQSLNKPRDSPSPDENEFITYRRLFDHAYNEDSLLANTWVVLARRAGAIPGYRSDVHLRWTEVKSPFIKLSHAQPDISESFGADQYPLEAKETLGGALLPTKHDFAMPRLCIEYKEPGGPMRSAAEQSAYDGALMVDAALQAHKYLGKPLSDFLNTTQALTIAINGEAVQQYSNHVIDRDGTLEYHQHHLQTSLPLDSLEHFQNAYRRVRNCQDWARDRAAKVRDEMHAFVRAGTGSAAQERTIVTEREPDRRKAGQSAQRVKSVPSGSSKKAPRKRFAKAAVGHGEGVTVRRSARLLAG